MSKIAFIAGRSNPRLAKEIFENIQNVNWINTIINDFANNEIFVKLKESVRGKDVYILQSFNGNPNNDLVESLILADTAFAASAYRTTLIYPTIYGSRQDRKSSPRTPVTISTIAKLVKSVNVDRVITVSLHAPQSSAAFYSTGLRFDNISSAHLFINKMREIDNLTIISPDAGGLPKARFYAEQLGAELAFIDKRRKKTNSCEVMNFVGKVKNKNCFIVDDMIDTGGSIIQAANKLKKEGANDIYCLATHLILSNDAIDKLMYTEIKKIYGTDSIYHADLPDKFEVFSLGKSLADVIERINKNKSVGNLFESNAL